MISTPSELARFRDDAIERVLDLLTNDDRVVAAWIGGSIGRAEEDAWSDVDLFVIVADSEFDTFWDTRQALYDAVAPQLLIQQPIPRNSQLPGGQFQLVIFEGPIEIDWTIAPLSSATRSANTLLLFERSEIPERAIRESAPGDIEIRDHLEFFWAMAPIAIKYAARDDMLATAGMIGMLRNSLIAIDQSATRPALTRLNRQIALIEVQRLCSEATIIGDDRRFLPIAAEIDRLILLTAAE